jgi:micrococcal nuclease
VLLVVLALGVGYLSGRLEGGADVGDVDGPPVPGEALQGRVVRVVDGDTVELAGRGKARLIGIDTPEVYGDRECFGPQASEFAKRELEGASVRYTVGREARDRYGRLLVYVWLGDGQSFNARLVAGGYARPLTIRPNDRYARTFARLAQDARGRDAGLWGRC